MSYGIQLLLKTPQEQLPVHLGPVWFLEYQEMSIAVDDRISVEGSRVSINGDQVLIAAEVLKDDDVLRLRDARGIPVWSAWRRRR